MLEQIPKRAAAHIIKRSKYSNLNFFTDCSIKFNLIIVIKYDNKNRNMLAKVTIYNLIVYLS